MDAVGTTPWAGSLVRESDPQESLDAAVGAANKATRDRLVILRGFAAVAPATYQTAALAAVDIEDNKGPRSYSRVESLRRRGSDLKRLGLIVQVSTDNGKAVFDLTTEGRNLVGA